MKDRIRAIRKHFGLNQTEFGSEINMKRGTVAGYETGSRFPLDVVIQTICTRFNVDEHWLRTGEGDMAIADTERDKLQSFFADVLATAPDERSAFVAALADLPDAFWPLVAELARKYADNLKKED